MYVIVLVFYLTQLTILHFLINEHTNLRTKRNERT
jgi:hypothetical protein